MDGKTDLSSVDWAVIAILKHELSILDIKEKKPKIRDWLQKRIKELESKRNDS